MPVFLLYLLHVILFGVGENLESVVKSQQRYIETMEQYKQKVSANFGRILNQLGLNLIASKDNKFSGEYQLIGTAFNEKKMLPIFQLANNYTGIRFSFI